MHSPADERQVEYQTEQDKQHRVQVFNLRFVDDRSDDKVSGDHKNDYWNDERHSVGTWVVGLCESHDDEGEHRATVEDPGGEAEEVDQRVDRSIEHHCAGDE